MSYTTSTRAVRTDGPFISSIQWIVSVKLIIFLPNVWIFVLCFTEHSVHAFPSNRFPPQIVVRQVIDDPVSLPLFSAAKRIDGRSSDRTRYLRCLIQHVGIHFHRTGTNDDATLTSPPPRSRSSCRIVKVSGRIGRTSSRSYFTFPFTTVYGEVIVSENSNTLLTGTHLSSSLSPRVY